MDQFSQPRRLRSAAIANLGCKVNRAEMEAVERLLRAHGVELVDGAEPADLVVVNTCTVTAIADRKSRQAVRRARRMSPEAQLLATGCLVSVDPEALAAVDPSARLFDNGSKDRLLEELVAMLDDPAAGPILPVSGVDRAWEATGPRLFEGEAEEGSADDHLDRADSVRTRAFVKIQDGCSFHCTYCIIPRARGPERSLEPEILLDQVRRALEAGHREVVLTGINVGSYQGGQATRSEQALSLSGLVRRILAETSVERIRLSSVEPQHVSDELLEVWIGSGGRCLPHLHLPLQSGDDAILRRMGRRYDAPYYAELVARVRRAIPGVAVHADVIAGFPGEDEAAWARTMAFLTGLDLAGIHVFRYSARPGTPAARMVGQVDARAKKRRAAEALALAATARAGFAERQLGRELRVLFERRLADGRWLGHAENHVPVVAVAPDGGSLNNAIGVVMAESCDLRAPDRIVGRLVKLCPAESVRDPLAESAFS